MLSARELKKVLSYDPDTGEFTRDGVVVGKPGTNGYRLIMVGRKQYQAHRLAFLYMEGAFPVDTVDHINHNRADNRWCNLRHSTPASNGLNRGVRSQLGVVGVSWGSYKRGWCVSLTIKGVCKILEYHPTLLDAVARRKSLDLQYGVTNYHITEPYGSHGTRRRWPF